MDQQKIGGFLKELRKERGVTQEQLAQILGVSNRSVSRWENGNNLPDLDLLIQISEYFETDLEELLTGERRTEEMDKKTKETVLQVADYSNEEKLALFRRLKWLLLAALAAFLVYMVLDLWELTATPFYADLSDAMLGLVFGGLLVGVLYTTRYGEKFRAFKKRLIGRK
ncbi:helix-turn-helix domain-containing protein [Neglectibacter caecimuris]|uniref:helix-turn-helix domain-containing protein n=1 Tax=Neglectibacter caecimuris TaxID=3093658 RepID=UPI002AC90374|nr:helix-turn-helix domain-containing protein [Neglectibacter sp. M00184]